MSKPHSRGVHVESKLSLDRFTVDEDNAHIELTGDLDDTEFDKLILCCPAGLYRRTEDGTKTFDYAGCLECGSCRILCLGTIVHRWEYPGPGMGVQYRFG
ncbi:MAG: ferredoxin family protein [Actinomyces sp.]|nr:ferredoxin family protein [Actinomyces sp.]MCI1788913.1 ferredoxin family protein [Actinomyces sp.]